MKKSQFVGLGLLLAVNVASAASIAIVDSGNDFEHKDLKAKAWINPTEIASNDRDEDRNGYPDDINGWNFAESNNVLIDYSYAWSDTPDVRKFFDIQLKSFLGTLTQEDKEWANAKLKEDEKRRELDAFIKRKINDATKQSSSSSESDQQRIQQIKSNKKNARDVERQSRVKPVIVDSSKPLADVVSLNQVEDYSLPNFVPGLFDDGEGDAE